MALFADSDRQLLYLAKNIYRLLIGALLRPLKYRLELLDIDGDGILGMIFYAPRRGETTERYDTRRP